MGWPMTQPLIKAQLKSFIAHVRQVRSLKERTLLYLRKTGRHTCQEGRQCERLLSTQKIKERFLTLVLLKSSNSKKLGISRPHGEERSDLEMPIHITK